MNRFALAVLFLIPAFAPAQQPSEAHKAELKKLAFLTGKWKGPADITGREGKQTLTQTEDVEYRLGGTILIIEGTGRGKRPMKDEEGVLFNAFAVVSYDAAAKKHKIKAYRMEGTSVEADLTLTAKGFNWGFKPPQGGPEVRYTMTITDKGEWNEVGEYTLDGKTWTKFFDMTLAKVKE
jgi:hypothetical protein